MRLLECENSEVRSKLKQKNKQFSEKLKKALKYFEMMDKHDKSNDEAHEVVTTQTEDDEVPEQLPSNSQGYI